MADHVRTLRSGLLDGIPREREQEPTQDGDDDDLSAVASDVRRLIHTAVGQSKKLENMAARLRDQLKASRLRAERMREAHVRRANGPRT